MYLQYIDASHIYVYMYIHLNMILVHAVTYMYTCITNYSFPIPGDTEGIDLTLVYDHLAFAEYSLGNLRKALQYTKDLLQNGM